MKKERCLKGCLGVNKISVIPNLIWDLPRKIVLQEKQQRQALKTLNQVQGDDLVCYNINAFTLIELLVVVLIIGILAAVALPQYKKAVYKSRFAKLELLTNEYLQAANAYRLATGEWPSEFDVLAITPTGTVATPTGNDCRKINDMFCCLSATIVNNQSAALTCGLLDNSLFYHTGLNSSERHCYAKKEDNAANSVCASRGDFVCGGSSFGCNVTTPTGHYTGSNQYRITK